MQGASRGSGHWGLRVASLKRGLLDLLPFCKQDYPTVTTVLSHKGQVVLPGVARLRMNSLTGDDFEVSIEDEDTIPLRRTNQPANRGPENGVSS